MMVGFSGYLVFGKLYYGLIQYTSYLYAGLIIGCAYDRITKIIPLFVVL
jgi:hypothetical protein